MEQYNKYCPWIRDYGLSSVLNLQDSPQNFPKISIVTKPNITVSVEQLKANHVVIKETLLDQTTNYVLLKFTRNNNNNSRASYYYNNNNKVQIGFRVDTTSVDNSNREFPDHQVEVHSEMDNRHIGDYVVEKGRIATIVRPEDKDEAILLQPQQSQEFIYYNRDIDLKNLFDILVKSGKGCCFSIKVTNGRMIELPTKRSLLVPSSPSPSPSPPDACDGEDDSNSSSSSSSLRIKVDGHPPPPPPHTNQQQQQQRITTDSCDCDGSGGGGGGSTKRP